LLLPRRLTAKQPPSSTGREYSNGTFTKMPIFGQVLRVSAACPRPSELLQRYEAVAAGRAGAGRLAGRSEEPSPEMATQPVPGSGDDRDGNEVLHSSFCGSPVRQQRPTSPAPCRPDRSQTPPARPGPSCSQRSPPARPSCRFPCRSPPGCSHTARRGQRRP